MIRKIVSNDEILKCTSFESPVDSTSLCIAKDLQDTLKYGWSMGRNALSLSARHIGEGERIITVSEGVGKNILTMFNPEIISKKDELIWWEENLCRPNVLFKTERAFIINVKYQLADGRTMKVVYRDTLAALVQQEIDNLNGILPEERALCDAEIATHPPREMKFGE